MKFSTKLLAMISAVAMLAACETAPGGNNGTGGRGGNAPHDGSQRDLEVNVGDRVFFDYDSSVINSEGEATLQRQAEWMKKNKNVKVTVEGHCDERGTREYNLALGERRASAVKSYLANLGVASNRVSTTSYGKERPAVAESDDSAYSQNRRGVTVVSN